MADVLELFIQQTRIYVIFLYNHQVCEACAHTHTSAAPWMGCSELACRNIPPICPFTGHQNSKAQKNNTINLQKRKQTAAVTSSVNCLIWSKSHMLIFCFPPTEVQTLGTTQAVTAKAPKADFLQKQCNLSRVANVGVKNTILLLK